MRLGRSIGRHKVAQVVVGLVVRRGWVHGGEADKIKGGGAELRVWSCIGPCIGYAWFVQGVG